MGTDAHIMIEHRNHNDDGWESLTMREFNCGRHYDFFDAIAGARRGIPMIEPRGLPPDCDEITLDAAGGGHSETWLTIKEFCKIKTRVSRRLGKIDDVQITAMLSAARSLEKSGQDVRLVIWFDS